MKKLEWVLKYKVKNEKDKKNIENILQRMKKRNYNNNYNYNNYDDYNYNDYNYDNNNYSNGYKKYKNNYYDKDYKGNYKNDNLYYKNNYNNYDYYYKNDNNCKYSNYYKKGKKYKYYEKEIGDINLNDNESNNNNNNNNINNQNDKKDNNEIKILSDNNLLGSNNKANKSDDINTNNSSKINENDDQNNNQDINILYQTMIEKISNNINDFYLNLDNIKSFSNNLKENSIYLFENKYIEINDKDIEEYYKKYILTNDEDKLKEKNLIEKENDDKDKNDNIINEIDKKSFPNQININQKENLIEFNFDNIIKINPDDVEIKKNKRKKNKNNVLSKNFTFYSNEIKNNNQIIHQKILDLINEYKENKSNTNISLTNYVFTKLNNFDFKNEFLAEYLLHKILLFEKPSYSYINIQLFEKYILLPLYHSIIINSRKRLDILNHILEKYIKIIINVCGKFDIIKEIAPYGSFSNTFFDGKGDIDICIDSKCPWHKFRKYINKIVGYIVRNKIGRVVLFHRAKSFLLVTIYDEETKNELDITVHNLIPIINSKLIKLYSQYDQRFHIMGIYLKYWSKLNKVHGAAIQYLSSYSLIIMLIYFLQNIVKPHVLPDLQNIPVNDNYEQPVYKIENYDYYDGHKVFKANIHIEENIEKIEKYMNYINKGEKNTESVSNLLLKFFEYYAYFYDNSEPITINKQIEITYNSKNKDKRFFIQDPFELNKNPAKRMILNSYQYKKFMNCMKKEINNILSGEYIKKLIEVSSSLSE